MRKALQLEIKMPWHGGKRRGAGRKRQGVRKRVSHRRRPAIDRHKPVHVTLRVLDDVGRLRRREAYRAIRAALLRVHERPDFQITHVSIQQNHLHLICEAATTIALSRGVSAFKISGARQLNRRLGRTGPVFADRYHAEIIKSPRHARNSIAYVLNNFRRHGSDTAWAFDWFSSAITFRHWQEGRITAPDGWQPLPVHEPRSWLLTTGWREHHAAISLYEVPGPR